MGGQVGVGNTRKHLVSFHWAVRIAQSMQEAGGGTSTHHGFVRRGEQVSLTCAQACSKAPNVWLSGSRPLKAISLYLLKAASVSPTCTGQMFVK